MAVNTLFFRWFILNFINQKQNCYLFFFHFLNWIFQLRTFNGFPQSFHELVTNISQRSYYSGRWPIHRWVFLRLRCIFANLKRILDWRGRNLWLYRRHLCYWSRSLGYSILGLNYYELPRHTGPLPEVRVHSSIFHGPRVYFTCCEV